MLASLLKVKHSPIFIIIGVLLMGLATCTQKTKKDDSDTQNGSADLFIGKWKSVKRATPYTAELKIHPDSTFNFNYGACLARGFAYGQWILTDSALILHSFTTDTCLFLREFGEDCLAINQLRDINQKTTIKNCMPENSDTYVLFREVKFQLIGDTLKHVIDRENFCPEIKNDFFRP